MENKELSDVQDQIVELKKKEAELLKTTKEKFSVKKALSSFNILDPIAWMKWFSGAFRTVIVLALVVALIFSAGYFKGVGDKPINVGYKDFTAQVKAKDGTVHTVSVKGGILYFDKQVVHGHDVKELEQFGIKIRPKVFFGMGTALEPEIGAGFQLLKYQKFNLDLFGTQKALYVGVSYDLDFSGTAGTLIQNSSVGIAVGKSWNSMFGDDTNDNRVLLYWSVKF